MVDQKRSIEHMSTHAYAVPTAFKGKKTIQKGAKVLILGSGGLKIGQAGEFDYSGSQAIKALKEEGMATVLVNPNIATVQTNDSMADRVYFLPLTVDMVEQVIQKEKPDALLLSFGGQTALNLGLELEDSGILKKHKVRVLGTPTATIRATEDRDLFAQKLREINVDIARSIATKTTQEAIAAAKKIGYPVMIRAAFALGGKGSGRANNETELMVMAEEAFANVPQILVEEYLEGWKEVEYEVVRDAADNCVTVCNMENFDPMGVHTGESIVVAPSQTLSNKEYHMLRTVAQKTVRHLGVVGECNIQYALNPKTSEYRVIEINARLSRSSALASKATGYPLAWVAAKIALGYTLPEIQNNMTQVTQACFEPSLDYVVVKMPRWDLQKFKASSRRIGTEMKSVGEVMAIGRSFEEALQKAIRSVNIGAEGLTQHPYDIEKPKDEIQHPTDRRLYAIANSLMQGETVDDIHQWSKIDKWFLYALERIVGVRHLLEESRSLSADVLSAAKKHGFSDNEIAAIAGTTADRVRAKRQKYGVTPVVKQIDTLAGEFPAASNYLYMTYHGSEHDLGVAKRNAVMVLGGGSYRIGSSVEFDWCCVETITAARKSGHETIMVNCNPETVSTDYDFCDRLYFEELTLERVLDIYEHEHPKGVVVSMGGQIPNTLALPLKKHGVSILGTDPLNIDRAEDRKKFSELLDRLGVAQPEWAELSSTKAALSFAHRVGYPVLIRPSYVLSGAAMNIAENEEALKEFLKEAADVSAEHPVVMSKFVKGAREIEIDGVAQNGELIIYALTEHVENAGVHSGDATIATPPQKSYLETVRRIKKISRELARELEITGPFNIQFLAKRNEISVIELNLRASRSMPFVSKATKYPMIQMATRAMLGESIAGEYNTLDVDYVAVKAPQFSYSRIKGADPVLYVEMGSTGEVACFGDHYREAVLKSLIAADFRLPEKNILLSIGGDKAKQEIAPYITMLSKLGYHLYATKHTAQFIRYDLDLPVTAVAKISEHDKQNTLSLIQEKGVDWVINIPTKESSSEETTNGFALRRAAIDHNIPLTANMQLAKMIIMAMNDLHEGEYTLEAKAWDEYVRQ